jgi:hypothetical protein
MPDARTPPLRTHRFMHARIGLLACEHDAPESNVLYEISYKRADTHTELFLFVRNFTQNDPDPPSETAVLYDFSYKTARNRRITDRFV